MCVCQLSQFRRECLYLLLPPLVPLHLVTDALADNRGDSVIVDTPVPSNNVSQSVAGAGQTTRSRSGLRIRPLFDRISQDRRHRSINARRSHEPFESSATARGVEGTRDCGLELSVVLVDVGGHMNVPTVFLEQVVKVHRPLLTLGVFRRQNCQHRFSEKTGLDLGAALLHRELSRSFIRVYTNGHPIVGAL